MRSTLDIQIAVSENAPATEQELRYALAALGSMYSFITRELNDLIEGVELDKFPKLRATNAKAMRERMFQAKKRPVDEWLGPDNIPGSPEQQRMLRIGKAICKKVTGIDLDTKEPPCGPSR